MNRDEIMQQLQPWKEKVKRPAWRPLVKAGDGPPTAPKFAGTPWLAQDESWPACKSCHKPMPLLLQLSLGELPAALQNCFGTGLLQLYYCLECDGGWQPFSDANLARIVHPSGTAQSSLPQSLVNTFPAKQIVGWEEFTDYPNPQEHGGLGLHYTYDWETSPTRTHIAYPELGLEFKNIEDNDIADAISEAATGDKLGGWPAWVQDVEYPTCPHCQRQMTLLFQLDSNDNLPYMFGDLGTGHITQCPEHKEVVAFGWASG